MPSPLARIIAGVKMTLIGAIVWLMLWTVNKYQSAEAWVKRISVDANARDIQRLKDRDDEFERRMNAHSENINWLVRHEGGKPVEVK